MNKTDCFLLNVSEAFMQKCDAQKYDWGLHKMKSKSHNLQCRECG